MEVAHVLPLLAQLGAYDGMVALALAKAKALDPETVAAQQSEAGRQAREVLSFGSFHASHLRLFAAILPCRVLSECHYTKQVPLL